MNKMNNLKIVHLGAEKEMEKKSTQSVIPQGELRCVWMDAGVAEFKLCDQGFRCETCEFNNNTQKQPLGSAVPRNKEESVVPTEEKVMTADSLFKTTLRNHLEDLRTFAVPQDRMYSRNHYWIQENETGEYRIGINHILANFFRSVGLFCLGVPLRFAHLSMQTSENLIRHYGRNPTYWVLRRLAKVGLWRSQQRPEE
jgi:hypothetical protein